jgi:hypothetical protein
MPGQFKWRYADSIDSPATGAQLLADLVDANRILADQHIVDAFGHDRARHVGRAPLLGAALAQTLGAASGADARPCCTVVAESVCVAVCRAVHTELNARPQLQASMLGEVQALTPGEGRGHASHQRGPGRAALESLARGRPARRADGPLRRDGLVPGAARVDRGKPQVCKGGAEMCRKPSTLSNL